jgi:hypothetical protein
MKTKMSRKVCFEAGYKQAKEEFEKMIEEERLKYRKIGSIKEQRLCEELKQKLKKWKKNLI